ncbi:MAG: hypothetical protein AB7F28_01635 [Candidatus Margulisiibacteriota bacterium]
MLTGKQKAQILLSLLGSKAQDVLSLLSPEKAQLLTTIIEDAPEPSAKELSALSDEITQRVGGNKKPMLTGDLSSSSSSLFSGESSFGAFDAAPEAEEPESPVESGPKLRPLPEVAALLSKEKPQLIAFILGKVEEPIKEELLSYLPDYVLAEVQARSVDSFPLSDAVFKQLYDAIFYAPEIPEGEEAPAAESSSTDSPFASSSSSSMFDSAPLFS